MADNHLKLNDSKTECLIIGRPHVLNKIKLDGVKVGSSSVNISHSAKNIGAKLDEQLSMCDQVNGLVRTCYGQLRQIGHIRSCLTQDATAILVNATVSGVDM